jgi:pyrroline-5-carboxylate reductase
MKIGFLGTGKITTSIVEGLIKSKANFKQILISKRSRKNSSSLAKKSSKVKVIRSNQEILDQANWVFIAITPKVAVKELVQLKFRKNQTVISFVSTMNLKTLKKLCKPATHIVKAGPLPMAEFRQSPTILYPYQKAVASFFSKIGIVVGAKDEKQNNHLWVMTSLMASYMNILKTIHDYLTKNKVKSQNANRYVSTFLKGMLNILEKDKFNFKKIIADLQTKRGINEELLKRLEKQKVFKHLSYNLNKIYLRLKKAND